MVTLEMMKQLCPKTKDATLLLYLEALNDVMQYYDMFDPPKRAAAFLAQIAHESGGFSALKENLNYRAETLQKLWPQRFDAATAAAYAGKPEAIANKVYGGRMGNGGEETGDGYRYCGRGLLQLTGKDNYSRFAQYAGLAVEDAPEYIESPRGAVHSACWFWYTNDLNTYADAADFTGMTKRINGGTIGLEDRKKHYEHAKHVFGA